MKKKIFTTAIVTATIEALIIGVALYFLFKNYPGRQTDITPEVTEEARIITTTVIFTPTSTPTPTPEPTFTPTPTPEPTPTPSPTPMVKKSNGYGPGKPGYYECDTSKRHDFKTFTHYKSYNASGTAQNRLQQLARTDEYGLRVVTDIYGVERWCVALGTYWCGGTPKDIGRCVDIYMENGATLHCVLGDVKRVEDTVDCKYGKTNSDLIEFIVDMGKLPEEARSRGNVSFCDDIFLGNAKAMMVYDYFIEGFGT